MRKKGLIKDKIDKLKEDFSFEGVYPRPLEYIANGLGYRVEYLYENTDFSGAIDYKGDVIYINANQNVRRQIFTLAHEIGHAVLHASDAPGGEVVDYRTSMYDPNNEKEKEANAFAAELLMPRDEFKRVWKSRNGNCLRVADYFGVSTDATNVRASSLRLNS